MGRTCVRALLGLLALTAPPIQAAPFDFDGGAGGAGTDWATDANWNPDGPNSSGSWTDIADELTVGGAFSPAAPADVFIGSTGAGGLEINTSGTATFNGHYATGWTHPGQITQSSGTVNVGPGKFMFMGINAGAQGRYDMDGGILNVQGFLLMGDAGGAGGVFEQTGGEVNVGLGGNPGTDYIGLASAANSSGTYSISGGSLSGNHWLSIGGHPVNPPNSGAVGLFEVIGTGPTSITVADLWVRSGTGTLRFVMDATGVAPITATNTVNVSGGHLEIDFTALPGEIGEILLIDNTGPSPISGAFAGATQGTTYFGDIYALNYFGGDGNDLVLSPPVPPVPYAFDNGAGDDDWNNGLNWDPDNPANTTKVSNEFSVGGAFSPTSATQIEIGSTAPGSLTLDTSGTLTVDSYLATGWDAGGQITHRNGTVEVASHLFMGIQPGAAGRYDMEAGTLNLHGFLLMGDSAGAGGVFTQTGGDVSVGLDLDPNTDYIGLASAANSSGTYSISGGSLTGTAELSIGAHPVNPPSAGAVGLFEVIGTGPTSITVANLMVRNGTGTLKFVMGGGGVTPVTATSTVEVSGGILDLDFSSFTPRGPITLINNTGANPVNGTFVNAAEGEMFLNGVYTLSYLGGDGNDVVLTSILGPELVVSRDQGTGELVFTWDSKTAKLYNLRSETDPSQLAPADWPIFGPHQDIPSTPPENTLVIPLPADPFRLFVIEEFNAPPVSLVSDDFESGPGDWTTGSDGLEGTTWELGAPANVGPSAANSPSNCFGTNLSADYQDDANVWLRSPEADLTTADSATLHYFQYFEIEADFDKGIVSVLDAGDDSVLAVLVPTVDGSSAGWEEVSLSLPAAALGKTVKIEFRLDSDDVMNEAGWYLDDFNLTVP